MADLLISGSSSVRPAVAEAVAAWRHKRSDRSDRHQPAQPTAAAQAGTPAAETILKQMPRREQLLEPQEGQLWLPAYEPLASKAGILRSLRRLLSWLRLLASLLLGILIDKLLRRDSLERRAARLRQTLERGGGTFVKLGQQAAMRIDLLPWEYCVELSKMLDAMTPFPVADALAAVERTTGRPWQESFAVFDPRPVGSASIACVFQATLKNGEKVVVKVRRPEIEQLFMADLRVLDWIMNLAEFFTIFRPGFSRNLRAELRDILMEELDFRREARYQDIFRRNVQHSGRDFFTAPKVFFELSGKEVLVQEFITGLWLWEVIAAVEHQDPRGRNLLREMNIDPAIVARRILWATFWSMDEHVFFHADPHPANILIRPNNEITFIDFGSCGSFNNTQKTALEAIVVSMKKRDVEAMARASLVLMEPLPPVDLPAVMKMSQAEYQRILNTCTTPAEYTEYWERTSARLWLGLISVARQFNIPVNLHMLRMIRATLLYDSIVLRLDPRLDRYDEYYRFMKDRAELVKLKWKARLRENTGDNLLLNVEEFGKALNDLLSRAQASVGRPIVSLGSTVNRGIFTASVLSRMAGRILWVTILLVAAVNFNAYLTGAPASFLTGFNVVLQSRIYQVFLVAIVLFNIRHILFRLRDRDQ